MRALPDAAAAAHMLLFLDCCRDSDLPTWKKKAKPSAGAGGGGGGGGGGDATRASFGFQPLIPAGKAKAVLSDAAMPRFLIGFAAAPGCLAQAAGAESTHSVFTAQLVAAIRAQPGVDIRLVLGDVITKTFHQTDGAQTPWVNYSLSSAQVVLLPAATPDSVDSVDSDPPPSSPLPGAESPLDESTSD